MQARKPKYNAAGTIDCEIEHPVYGWIPFTASPEDSSEEGRVLHAAFLAGEHGEIAAYIAPTPSASELLSANNRDYESATRKITADYPQLEKDTWPTQNSEAMKWVADPVNARTPWIDAAAQARGLTREDYLRRTLVKAQQFSKISAHLTGVRQKYEDQIKQGITPVMDYTIPATLQTELQEQANAIMTYPVEDLHTLV